VTPYGGSDWQKRLGMALLLFLAGAAVGPQVWQLLGTVVAAITPLLALFVVYRLLIRRFRR
jgi:hypothetical protein